MKRNKQKLQKEYIYIYIYSRKYTPNYLKDIYIERERKYIKKNIVYVLHKINNI